MRKLAVVGAGLAAGLAALAVTMVADAGPAPSATVVVACYRGVDINPGEGGAQIYNISLRDANGATVGFGQTITCPTGGGGARIRAKVPVSAKPVAATFSCWNGFIQTGTFSGPITLTGECADTVPNPDVPFAKVTIR